MSAGAASEREFARKDPNRIEDADLREAAGIWDRVRRRLRAELGEDVFSSWFARVDLEGLSAGVVRLSVPTVFLKGWIKSHYGDRLLALWREEDESVRRIDVMRRTALRVVAEEPPSPMVGKPAPAPVGEVVGDRFAGSPLDPRLTFATFCEGRSNDVACRAARAVAGAPEGSAPPYNPLYIHAGVGLGKTHLLQAIAHEARALDPSRRARYLTVERFTVQFVAALRDRSALDFKEQLRSIDILLIDDMQFLTGRAVQQEFCHMLNQLLDSGKQVVVAADRPPAELEGVDERVRSRMKGGVVVGMAPPDLAMRRRILESRLAAACERNPSLVIPDAVLDYVAQVVTSNGRDLDGALNRLVCRAEFSDAPMTMEIAEMAIADLVGDARAAAHPHRGHPEGRGQPLQRLQARSSVGAPHARHRAPAADCDVSGEDHDAAVVPGDRQAVRRSRPHDGAACRPQGGRACRRRRGAGPGDRAFEALDPGLAPRRGPEGAVATCLPGCDRRSFRLLSFMRCRVKFDSIASGWAAGDSAQFPRIEIMRVRIERANLLKALNHVHRVVERRNTIPILANVLLRAEGSELSLKATDLDMEIVDKAPAAVEQPGAATVPAHMLYDIVRKLPDGAEIALDTESGQTMALKAGRARFALQMLPDSDFPDLNAGELPVAFTLSAEVLKRLIDRTQFAISTEETRYYLNGIYFHVMGEGAEGAASRRRDRRAPPRQGRGAGAGRQRRHAGHHRAAKDRRRDSEASGRSGDRRRRSASPTPRSAWRSATSC